jgi:hypothetical protein
VTCSTLVCNRSAASFGVLKTCIAYNYTCARDGAAPGATIVARRKLGSRFSHREGDENLGFFPWGAIATIALFSPPSVLQSAAQVKRGCGHNPLETIGH